MFNLNNNLWVLHYTYKVSLTKTSIKDQFLFKNENVHFWKKEPSKLFLRLITIIFHGRKHTGHFSFILTVLTSLDFTEKSS